MAVQAPTVDKLYALGQTIGANGNNTFQARGTMGGYSPRQSGAAAPQQQQSNGGLSSVAGDMAGKGLQMYQAGLLGGGSTAASTAGTGAALNSAAATGASNVAAGMGASAGTLPSAASMGFGGGAAAGGSAGAAGGAGASGAGALFSNPVTGLAALIAGNVIYQNNKGITSYEEALKGQAGGKTLDYYGGRNDGKTHGGILGKIADKDGATGQSLKGITDFSELDFKNGIKNSTEALKSALKFKFF